MLCSSTLSIVWKTLVIILEPPGVPTTITSLPFRSMIVGVIELSMRLFGSILLASPPITPYIFGEPGFALKSSISSFNKKPEPATITLEPYASFNVVVTATAFPSGSITERCVVSGDSYSASEPSLIVALGVACSGSNDFIRSSVYKLLVSCFTGTFTKSGSPKYTERSA